MLTLLDPYLLELVFEFLYDASDYRSYALKIQQFEILNKEFHAMTRERSFLERFYFYMFPANSIPKTAIHSSDTCVTNYKKYDVVINANGYLNRTYWGGWPGCGRCKDPSHYDLVVVRANKSKFKNMFTRCRNKYVNIMIANHSVSAHAVTGANNKKRF